MFRAGSRKPNGESGKELNHFKIFQELHPEFPGMGSEHQNLQLKTKQKGKRPHK
jgi:hypothetical protein